MRCSRLCGWHQFCNVAVELREPTVESSESTVVHSSQLRQIRIGHLSMTNNTGEVDIVERDAVRPEFVPLIRSDPVDELSCRTRSLPFPQQQAYQAALRHRACGKRRTS